jgi:cobalt-zinc-cadmium efflux system outer membrane protein
MIDVGWIARIRQKTRSFAVIGWLVVLPTPSLGANDVDAVRVSVEATSPKGTLSLTWGELVHVVDQHPRLSVSRLQAEAVRREAAVVRAVPNPLLEGNVGQGVSRTDGTSRFEWGLAVTMPLGWLVQRGVHTDVANAESAVALAETEVLRRDVLFELRSLFWNLAYEQFRVASLQALETETRTLATSVKKRVEKGESRPIEATRVELELEKVISELTTARTLRDSREAALTLWLNVPSGTHLSVDADFDTLPSVIERDAALSRVRAGHPLLNVANARLRLRDAELRAEKLATVPSFALRGSASHELDRRAYGVGVAVNIPLFDWNTGRIEQAESRRAAESKQVEATVFELSETVLAVQAACAASVATAVRARDNVVPRAEITASTMERTYALGEVGLLDVIDARRGLLEARRAYLSALAVAQIDCSRLSVLIGETLQ